MHRRGAANVCSVDFETANMRTRVVWSIRTFSENKSIYLWISRHVIFEKFDFCIKVFPAVAKKTVFQVKLPVESSANIFSCATIKTVWRRRKLLRWSKAEKFNFIHASPLWTKYIYRGTCLIRTPLKADIAVVFRTRRAKLTLTYSLYATLFNTDNQFYSGQKCPDKRVRIKRGPLYLI